MNKLFTEEDDALLAELGVEVEQRDVGAHTPREERIIAGFEDIQRFVDAHGRLPRCDGNRDVLERLRAVRLDRLRGQEDCRALLDALDRQGLVSGGFEAAPPTPDSMDDDELLAELGDEPGTQDIFALLHVRPGAERRIADEIGNRSRCRDFDVFRPLFEQVRRDVASGVWETRPFRDNAAIGCGDFFVVGGQMAYVSEKGREAKQPHGRVDARLRVVFDNGTESNILMRSLERALQRDKAGRRIVRLKTGPLFAGKAVDGDRPSGAVYVLRSKADIPLVVENRNLVHKIGVTGGEIDARIAGAQTDPTFLMAGVEKVATYKLFGIDRVSLERLIHRIFARARLDIEVKDRFGKSVVPREWFLVPLQAVDEAIDRIRDGTIDRFVYDLEAGSLVASR